MNIKIFIVTYRNSTDLHNNLASLFGNFENQQVEVNIINNHSEFQLDSKYNSLVKVYHNCLRPDFSTGHLARNWNQAIINGFKDLNHPDCDILIHCQDDTIFSQDWLSQLIELHQSFDFVQMGVGDNFCSYLPSAVKKVGLWDEHFCGLGFGEADYFLRCLIYNQQKSCINDVQHGRLLNPVNFSICRRPAPANIFSPDHHASMKFHPISERVFRAKWGDTPPNYWHKNIATNHPKISNIPNFILYPYFEKDIDLTGKNYI